MLVVHNRFLQYSVSWPTEGISVNVLGDAEEKQTEFYITQAQVMSDRLISSISFPNMERTNISLKAHLMSLLVLQSLMISCIDMSRHTFECSQTMRNSWAVHKKRQQQHPHQRRSVHLDHNSGPYLLTSCHNGALLCRIFQHFHTKNKIKTQSFQHSTNKASWRSYLQSQTFISSYSRLSDSYFKWLSR